MVIDIDDEAILARFDDLVSREAIFFSPPTTVQHQNGGFPLQFHISLSLLTKPDTAGQHFASDGGGKPECFGPGSDIANSDPDLLLAVIHNTHLLVINKFCVFRPQLLLLTRDSYRRQREPLALDDFSAVCTALLSLKNSHLAIYNCGPVAGASRDHKHLQILPRPCYLFPDDADFDERVIPYRFFLRYLRDVDFRSSDGPLRVSQIYQTLLDEAKGAVAQFPGSYGGDYFPHNVALVKDWIIVIPRQRTDVEGLTANAAGMLGTIFLKEEVQLDRWKQVGPARVLSGLGLPREA